MNFKGYGTWATRLMGCVGVASVVLSPLLLQGQVIPEENQIRDAYAKLNYAAQLKVITDIATEHYVPGRLLDTPIDSRAVHEKLADSTAIFSLGGFKTGNAADLTIDEWCRLRINQDPFGVQLKVQQEGLSAGDTDVAQGSIHAFSAFVSLSWTTELNGVPSPDQIVEVCRKSTQQLHQAWQSDTSSNSRFFARYVVYTVSITFQGRSVGPYTALAMFGRDDKGKEVAEIMDNVIDNVMINGED